MSHESTAFILRAEEFFFVHVFSFFILGSGVEIVICTSHGEVLEFSGCQIRDICEISCLDPKSIIIFTTYDFKCNIFYIISSGNGIIILSRKEGLKVCDIVTEFCLCLTCHCHNCSSLVSEHIIIFILSLFPQYSSDVFACEGPMKV
jgi:hypothetical protein